MNAAARRQLAKIGVDIDVAGAHRRAGLRGAPDGRARQGADAGGNRRPASWSSCSTSRPRCSAPPTSTALFSRVQVAEGAGELRLRLASAGRGAAHLGDRVYTMKDGAVVAEHRSGRRDDRRTCIEDHGRARRCRPEYYKETRQAAPRCRSAVVEAAGLGVGRRVPRRRSVSCVPARSSASPAWSARAARR